MLRRSWAVPVKELLSVGLNTLTISLRPATAETLSRKANHAYSIPSLQQLGSVGAYVFARKPASDFGWWVHPREGGGICMPLLLCQQITADAACLQGCGHMCTMQRGQRVLNIN